ncbi:MAG: hypothetical protein R2685_10590 [Candidatus Nitrosocosmicus sp.]|nr:hypothetical protein [Candidatus Nitrosocosmicus sp.]
MNPRTEMIANSIENLANVNMISNDELIVHLGHILKQRIKANTEYALSHVEFSTQALFTNKLAKTVLNDIINEIDKKRNVLRSLEKEVRKNYR